MARFLKYVSSFFNILFESLSSPKLAGAKFVHIKTNWFSWRHCKRFCLRAAIFRSSDIVLLRNFKLGWLNERLTCSGRFREEWILPNDWWDGHLGASLWYQRDWDKFWTSWRIHNVRKTCQKFCYQIFKAHEID